jgi:hypothetical protein
MMGVKYMGRIYRLFVLILIAVIAGVIILFLASNYMTAAKDLSVKGTIAAGIITVLGVIFSAIYKEISAYYQERSEIICRKWDLIFPFIKNYYNAWIHSAESLRLSLKGVDNNKPSDLAVTRVLYYTALFYEYRLRFIINGGGLILLSSNEENDIVMEKYREIQKSFQWAGDETPVHVSYLQKLFTLKNKPEDPYVLHSFIKEFQTDKFLNDSKEKLQSWLSKDVSIKNLEKKLGEFIESFNESIENLYKIWGD